MPRAARSLLAFAGQLPRIGALLATLVIAGCLAPAPSSLAPQLRGSVGVPHHGVLTDAVSLPDRGRAFARYRGDDVRWGLPALVATIEHASLEVSRLRPDTPRLLVGDLSRPGGGQAERHSSHRTGRDVDLLFYSTTPRGKPVPCPGFVRYGSDGLGRVDDSSEYLRFDVDRNWLLVRALLESPHGPPQWIFVSAPLEALLMEHAGARDEPIDLLYRAANVMKEPTDGLPHDDHFHVRLACSPDQAVAGCSGGPWWPWQPPAPTLRATDGELVAALLEE